MTQIVQEHNNFREPHLKRKASSFFVALGGATGRFKRRPRVVVICLASRVQGPAVWAVPVFI